MLGIAPSQILLALAFAALLASGEKLRLPRIRLALGLFLLGTVGLYPLDEGACELRKMYFTAPARGRGLGKYILERAIVQAKNLGFRRIILETASVLEAANHLYVKYGFRPLERDHLPSRADLAYILDLNEK